MLPIGEAATGAIRLNPCGGFLEHESRHWTAGSIAYRDGRMVLAAQVAPTHPAGRLREVKSEPAVERLPRIAGARPFTERVAACWVVKRPRELSDFVKLP